MAGIPGPPAEPEGDSEHGDELSFIPRWGVRDGVPTAVPPWDGWAVWPSTIPTLNAHPENGKASVGLKQIDSNHDFYNLEGSDNIILFYTNRYKDQPLIVKGAGAGADVTAGGIFGDIIRIGKR